MEIFAVSTTGAVHLSRGKPCQDSYSVSSYGNAGLILSVADGHGGAAYCRSEIGSLIACSAAADIIRQGDDTDLPVKIKQEYDRRVQEHLERNPLTVQEAGLLESLPPDTAYGTTLLAAAVSEAHNVVLQLGDGEIHAMDAQGHFLPALPEDEDCFGSFTSSMCYSEAEAVGHFRTLHYAEKPALIIMYSDGYSSKYSRPYELVQAFIEGAALSEVLQQGAHGDDQTVLIAADRSLTAAEAFRQGFAETLSDYKSEAAALRDEIFRRRMHEEIKSTVNFLLLAEIKMRECRQNGDQARLSRLEALSEQKRAFLELYQDLLPQTDDDGDAL